jgi:hypothetical protein
MNFDIKYHIKKVIYKNSQLLRDNLTQIKKFFNKEIIHSIIGGGKDLTITYKDNEYKYTQIMDEDYYILYSYDDFGCVSVVIDKENIRKNINFSNIYNKVGEIHEIGNFKSCLIDSNTKVGSTLLKITIKMLKKYKDIFEINKIVLTDNSIKKCESNKEDIKLSHMLILLTGDTWYGKYGFRPINVKTYDYDKILNKNYHNNKLIINNITIKEANIMKYIKMTKDENVIKQVKKILEKDENMLLKDFLQKFLSEYESTCSHFSLFYDRLYDDLKLEKFYRLFFGLNI